jgi:hypothetical protein
MAINHLHSSSDVCHHHVWHTNNKQSLVLEKDSREQNNSNGALCHTHAVKTSFEILCHLLSYMAFGAYGKVT